MDAPFIDPMNFGKGVFGLNLDPRRSEAVIGQGLASVVGSGASQQVTFSLLHATTFAQFESAFSANVEASGRYGLYHGDGSYNFAQDQKYNSFTHYLVVRVDVLNQFRSIQSPQLNPATDGLTLLAAGDESRFLEEFGDMYVSGIRQGGVYTAVLSFASQTQEEFQSESASIQLGISGFVSTEASFSSSLHSFSGSTNLTIRSFQNGGTDSTPAITIDDIIKKALGFANEVRTSAQSVSVTLESYRTLSLPKPPNLQKLEDAKAVIERLGRLRTQFVQMLNDVEYVRDHPGQFVDADKFDAHSAADKLIESLNKLRQNASACADDVNQCEFVNFDIPLIILPAHVPDEAAALAIEGARIAKMDSLLTAVREQEPEISRRGFDIGLAKNPNDTLQGPGKEKFKMSLPAVEQAACQRGYDYHIDRNFAGQLVEMGKAVVKANPSIAAAFNDLPVSNQRLGFIIAAGQFGKVADGGNNDGDQGGKSRDLRNGLSPDVQRGFDAAVAFLRIP